ncbi:MAG: Mur ligase family protein [Candidatus Falkowbacteria bacterium]
MKKIIQWLLKILAKWIVLRYQPEIIGITGSAGKTSTREAVFAVLSVKYSTRQTIKNYNNEFGLPLTIIGVSSPGSSLWGWFLVIRRAISLLLVKDKNYPEILVLEYGIDRPGDMFYLLSIARPQFGILTLIGPSHLEFFGNLEKVEREKGLLLKSITPNGWAIINADDERCRSVAKNVSSKVISFGFNDKATVRAVEIFFGFEHEASGSNLRGVSFKLSYDGSVVPVLLPQVLGYGAIYAALAAAAIGVAKGINLIDISQALRNIELPRGRMTLIEGKNNTTIIDDTYNASPEPVMSALRYLGKVPMGINARRVAILGDMKELGSFSVEGHRLVGQVVYENSIDVLIVVGELAKEIGASANKVGLSKEKLFQFDNATTASEYLKNHLIEGDVILIKGSQSMRMERIVKSIMAEPTKAKDLLVRQDWTDA